eukprot:maker-scaffold_23-snap-gene-4.62-mRNA-1 protein AED:0.04 eAED:0.04 QI:82/1/1/1/1/1/6/29/496
MASTARKASRVIIEEEELHQSKVSHENTVTEDLLSKEKVKTEENKSVVSGISELVRWVSTSVIGAKDRKRYERLLSLLAQSTMFTKCTKEQHEKIAALMELKSFKKGEALMLQGEKQEKAFIIIEGTVVRKKLIKGQLHVMNPLGSVDSADSIGMMHLLNQEPAYSNVLALSDGCVYTLDAEDFRDLVNEDPQFSSNVIQSLIVELRRQTKTQRTPLFLQQGKDIPGEALPWFAISCAASIESFYRSALNALLIGQLGGGKRPAFFPNMHVQLPTRVVYINGFKGIRYFLDHEVDPLNYQYPSLVGMGLAVAPGLIMSPVSSVLEAQNVTHMNNEPLMRRWTRGLVPRMVREVLFGVGINQLSDYFEERFDNVFESTLARNFAGSLTAGAIAGYLSHVPHNLSMLKLMEPNVSYGAHFTKLTQTWDSWYRTQMPANSYNGLGRRIMVPSLTVLLPKGCLIRTAQISGSFLIINSAINALKHINVNFTMSKKSGVVS